MSVIINYCSNERMFLDPLLKECSKFSDDIVVSYGSHLYDGTMEDLDHIKEYQEKYPNIQFVCYIVDKTIDLSKQKGVQYRPTAYWHNLARWTAIKALKKREWVFIIDADEIPEGDLVKHWLDLVGPVLNDNECYKIATHWYFKSPCDQATVVEDSILLIHSKHLTENNIFGDYERDHLIKESKCILRRQIVDDYRQIMWHHFSWVRSKKGLEHKIANWGHCEDIFKGANAKDLVDYIYRDNNVNDIVHKYTYRKVDNRFSISLE